MRKILSLITAAVMMLSLNGCGKQSTAKETTSDKAQGQMVTIGVLPDTDSIPFIIAEKNGYFKKQGINVVLEKFNSAKDRDSAFQAGKVDGAITDVLAVAFAKEAGFNIKITSKSDGGYKLLVGKNSGIKSVNDMKGKSNALSLNTIIEYSTDRILGVSGLNGTDVKKVSVPQIPTRLEMLQNGKIDSATLPEPLATVAIKNGAIELNSTDKLGINAGVVAFSQKAIDTKAKEIEGIYKAYNEAIEYIQNEPVANFIDTIIKESKFPEEVKDSLVLPKYTKAVMPKEKDIDEAVKWLVDKKLIKSQYKAEDLSYDKFVK